MGAIIFNLYSFFRIYKQKPTDPSLLRTWMSWKGMFERCHGRTYITRNAYIEIEICDAWKDSSTGFINFLRDMGIRPEGMSLEKQGFYSKETCCWANDRTQTQTRRRNRVGLYVSKARTGYRVIVGKDGAVYCAYLSAKLFTEEEALNMADAIALQVVGETAPLNFPNNKDKNLVRTIPHLSFYSKERRQESKRKHAKKYYAALHER